MSGNGNSGSANFGGGGDIPAFDCAKVSIKTNIISTNPSVLATIKVGDILTIQLQTATGPLVAVSNSGNILGAIFTKDPTSLIKCINDGYVYQASVINISGGDVQVLITNK